MPSLDVLGLFDPGSGSDYGPAGDPSPWLEIDWQEHLRQIQVGGREVNYVDLGEGPAIVFVHGLGAMWQCWLENLPEFARDHRVIAMDLPGFGHSQMPDEEISMEFYGRWLAEFLDAIEIPAATLIGNSMGGFVSAQFAIKSPERVERLILVSAAIFWQEYRRAKPLMTLARVSEAGTAELLATAGHPKSPLVTRSRLRILALLLSGFRYPHLLSPEFQHELITTARRTKGFVPALHALGTYPVREELPKIEAPTLIIWGAQDPLVTYKHGRDLAKLIPDCELMVFERTGHEAFAERPKRFHRVVREYLEQTRPFGDSQLAGAETISDRPSARASA